MRRLFFSMLCVLMLTHCSEKPVEIHDSNGKLIPTVAYAGKWVVLNYWAKWCKACREEVPQVNLFYRHNPSVVVYGVSFDWMPMDQLKDVIQKMHIQFPVISDDPARIWPVPMPEVLPYTVIIGPDGRVRQTLNGVQTEISLSRVLHDLQRE